MIYYTICPRATIPHDVHDAVVHYLTLSFLCTDTTRDNDRAWMLLLVFTSSKNNKTSLLGYISPTLYCEFISIIVQSCYQWSEQVELFGLIVSNVMFNMDMTSEFRNFRFVLCRDGGKRRAIIDERYESLDKGGHHHLWTFSTPEELPMRYQLLRALLTCFLISAKEIFQHACVILWCC